MKFTPIPLASLLNRIFGDDRWRALLKIPKSTNHKTTTPALPTTYPQDYKGSAVSPGQGFQNYQVSADNLFPFSTKKEHDGKTHVNKSDLPSRVGNKSVGNHFSTEVPNIVPSASEHHDNFGSDNGYPNYPSPDSVNNQPFQFSNTQTHASNTGAQEKQNQYFGGNMKIPSSTDWFSSSSFDPDKVNSQAGLYNPNRAFDSFVTQTGSNKDNARLSTSYDADAVNQRYMQTGGVHFPPSMTQSGQTTKENQHSNDKYQYGSVTAFDADALNTALMNRLFVSPKGNTHLGKSQSGTQYHQGFSPFQKPQHVNYPKLQSSSGPPTVQQLMKNEETVKQPINKASHIQSSSVAKTPNSQGKQPNAQFSFIPGRLSSGRTADSSYSRQYSRPSFLSLSENSQSAPVFDPNALNAAQALYNPNALSWITLGHKRQLLYEVDDAPSVTNASIRSNLTDAKSINKSSSDNLANNNASSIPVTKTDTAYAGFDPNLINAQQGQASFVPGQIAPHFFDGAGYSSFQGINQGQSAGYVKPTDQDSNLAPGIGFGMGGFNPDSVNTNFANMFGNDSTLGLGISNNGANSMSLGFGSFGTNAGISNGSDPYQMYGYGMSFGNNGFDANAVNMPGAQHSIAGGSNASSGSLFDASFGGFGGFPAMNNGGYGASTYDANQVNQQLIQNPFASQTPNSTGNGMDYFLGVSTGGQNFGAGSSYQSPFISAFDPSSVNQAVYDPNKYNNAHINFDPLEMLSKNPGMDKATLQSASFDPDKANNAYTQINFSPVGMIASTLGLNTTVLNGATFDPSTAGQASFIPSQMGNPYTQSSSNQSSNNQPVFDPVEIMRQLMKDSSMFVPGTSGSQKVNFDPSSVFQQGSQTGSSVRPIIQQQVTTTQMPTYITTGIAKSTTAALPTTRSSRASTKASLTTIFTTVASLMSNTTSP